MKHEESARWPFSPDLPKWFQDWIIQKRLSVDPKFKDQWKMANSLRIADSWEARETRRQLAGKRRMVEQVVEEMPKTEEVRVCRFPMVTLPGVGDVCPFEDTSNLVVPKGPDVMPPLDVLTNKNDSDNTQSMLALTNDAQSGGTIPTTVLVSPSRMKTSEDDSTKSIVHNHFEIDGDYSKESNELGRPHSLKGRGSYSPLLGSQAQVIPWPSNDLWSMRSKSLEYDFGPKKRKVLDGIVIEPKNDAFPESTLSSEDSGQTSRAVKREGPVTRDQGKACSNSNPQEQKPALKCRGRPPKDVQSHGPKIFSLKRQARNTVKKRQESIRSNWEKNAFDLKIDLNNHFVVVDYIPKPIGSAGGLALCWKLGVDCNIQRADKFQIQACISSDPPDKPWILMGVYGPPVYAEKEGFWKEISEFVCNCTLPVLLIGDLNGTLLDSDCLNYSRASNISRHLTAASSDHNPIILDTCGGRHCSKPQFKYELLWERDPRVFWVVKKAWMTQSHRDPMVNMYFINDDQTWNVARIRAWFDSTDAINILNIGLPATKQEDSWQWLGEKRGLFSIKSAYHLIIKHRKWNLLSMCYGNAISLKLFGLKAYGNQDKLEPVWKLDIWKVRNDVCHGAHQVQNSEAIRAVRVRYRDHHSCNQLHSVKSSIDLTPPLGWMTCCTDVSIDINLSVGAAVFRDDRNRICGVFAACFTATELALAEAHTLAMAGHYAVQNQFMRVGFLCDNAVMVSNFLETNPQNLHLNLAGTASKFRSSTLHLQSFQLSKIGREQNFMAHNAAKWVRINDVVGEIAISLMPSSCSVRGSE
ncbi:hypothetical protein F8388_022870 [Cannabis sativa]|uniref:RNase H type-1 domain-containing protein n=1 Tax=Cannabis sativa TaxID=3483 RepID=A0A7J6FC12_CANSA|nr:hypothetical protein F8388_022870 [Cannabis sativa]